MAGIYIHIPFCKTRCVYCDFYSTTHKEWKQRYIHALCRELSSRRNYLKGAPVETLYLGGGTPSQLDEEAFQQLFCTLRETYGLEQCREVTIEVNPDDLTEEYVEMLARLPFNRISMGIQTFDDRTLSLLHRRHTAQQAREAVERLRRAGFGNISIDLIYGLPEETDQQWEHDLEEAIALEVEHISAYHLTYEEGTPLYDMLQRHRVHEVDEEASVRFFSILMDRMTQAGYEHYEISNFCKPGRHSRHNTAYWQGIPYLGCGPSAHSYDIDSREWNIASLEAYVKGMEAGERPYETEQLDLNTRYNEHIMTALRTRQGVSVEETERRFGTDLHRYCLEMAAPYLKSNLLELTDNCLRLTRAGIFVSDGIISNLMKI